MLWRARKSFVNRLLPSSRAASRAGPKQASPAAWNSSTTPATSGPSGPTIVSATPSFCASATRPGMSLAATGTFRHLASAAVPALPGATSTSVTRGDCASFQARACSRPPPPMTRTLTARSMTEVPHAGEDHRDVALVRGGDDLGVAQRPARLDHCTHAVLERGIEPVAERKKRVGGHDAAGNPQFRVRRLHRGDARRDHTAGLARADADRATVLDEHDGVRFHVLADAPGEQQVGRLRGRRRAARDAFQLVRLEVPVIARLREQTAGDRAVLDGEWRPARERAGAEQSYVLPGREDRERIRCVIRCHDHLDELAFDDRGRGRRVDAAVEGDYSAEG